MKKLTQTLFAFAFIACAALASVATSTPTSAVANVVVNSLDNFTACHSVVRNLNNQSIKYPGQYEPGSSNDRNEASRAVSATILEALYSNPSCVAEISAKKSDLYMFSVHISVYYRDTLESGDYTMAARLNAGWFEYAGGNAYSYDSSEVSTLTVKKDDNRNHLTTATSIKSAINNLGTIELSKYYLQNSFDYSSLNPTKIPAIQSIMKSYPSARLSDTTYTYYYYMADSASGSSYNIPLFIDGIYYDTLIVPVDYSTKDLASTNGSKVMLSSAESAPADTELIVQPKAEDSIKTGLKKDDRFMTATDLSLYSRSANKYLSNFTYGARVRLYIPDPSKLLAEQPTPAPAGHNIYNHYYARYINSAGEITEPDIPVTIVEDSATGKYYAEFTAKHFSVYAIIHTINPITAADLAANIPTTEEKHQSTAGKPDTGFFSIYNPGLTTSILIALATTSVITFSAIYRSRRRHTPSIDAKIRK